MEDIETLKNASVVLRRYGFADLSARVDVARTAVLQLTKAIAETSADKPAQPALHSLAVGETPGQRLRAFRKAAKLSADDLGRSAGLSAVSVRAHENGQNGMKLETAEQYAIALGISPSAILFGQP